jgi:4-amino-4-deoxy-L-arabinose transferase-like glycosyltransferase
MTKKKIRKLYNIKEFLPMTTATVLSQPAFLKKNLGLGITPAILILLAIMLLSLGLHLYNIESIGDANAYYTAAVESMLQSPSNFFFVAAEPGGSVTVDKPPLGLWIEALFAYFLGVSGFSTSLPNIIAGVLGIPVLYILVKKYAGELAGLVAALVMALTPTYLATNRNNTMDGRLVFFLLLAAWAFINATETGKFYWVLLGGFIVGLGFNIKMAQAFLPLPAFYALYFLASKIGWLRKALNLGIATVLVLAVSLAWAVIVDLVPADSRPYIGSSHDNTVMGLILEHNGGSRIVSGGGPQGAAPQGGQNQPQNGPRQGAPQEALDACANLTQGAECSFQGRDRAVNGTCIMPPNLNQLACAPQGMIPPQNGQAPAGQRPPLGGGPNGGGTPFSQETGEPGALRFFTSPLSKQMSWLLPFALISIALALFSAKIQLPIESGIHKALILWGGWLLTCVVFFSMISGIFHSYYAIMLVPPLGAMVGVGFAQLWAWSADRKWTSALLIASALITLAFQVFATYQYAEKSLWLFAAAILFGLGIMLMEFQKRAAYLLILAAMMVIPAYWTVMTVTSSADHNLPTAYTGGNAGQNPNMRAGKPPRESDVNRELLAELQANTQGMKYLVAVPSSQQGAQLVLATGRPVLYMGGFGGQDDVTSLDELKSMIANGELRYVMYGGERGNKPEIAAWLKSSCVNLADFTQTLRQPNGQPGPENQQMFLYRCE